LLIDASEIKHYTDEQLVIITTGSQGEPMSALSRIAAAEHRQIEVKPGDKIIISASPIPGNEKTISKVINDLMQLGAEVLYEGLMEVHVSGHAKQEEIKLLHALVKPRFLMPVHGEYRHLKRHRDLAISMGMPKDDIFLLGIGDVLELSGDFARINGTVPTGQLLIDGSGVGDVSSVVLRDRKHLAEDGLVIVAVGLCLDDGYCQIMAGPDIISRGFVYMREAESLIDEAKSVVRRTLCEIDRQQITEWTYMRNAIRDALKDFIWQKTRRNPMILPVIMEV